MEVLITKKDSYCIIGTGLYFTYEQVPYVVTCAHVVDEPSTTYGVIANPSRALWRSDDIEHVELGERLSHPRDTSRVRHDILVYRLETPLKTIAPSRLVFDDLLSHRSEGYKLELRGYSTRFLSTVIDSTTDERLSPERIECVATGINDMRHEIEHGVTEARFNVARVGAGFEVSGGHSGSPVYDLIKGIPIGIAFYANPLVTAAGEFDSVLYVPIESVIELISLQ